MGGSQNSSHSESQLTIQQIQTEIAEFDKEINMLNELQKQYSQELNNFAKWKQELDFRKTLLGKIGNAVGKITAVVFMIKFYNGVWNALYTSDQWEY
jgi:predicted metalloendopeptidase